MILNSILLTQYDGAILGPIAKVLGWIMNGIFWVLDKIGIGNHPLHHRGISSFDAFDDQTAEILKAEREDESGITGHQ